VSYTAGAADAAKLSRSGGRSGGGDAKNANSVVVAAAAAAAPSLDAEHLRRRKQQPAPAAAETTPAPPRRRVEWESDNEQETPLTQQQRIPRNNSSSESSPLVCFLLDLFSWRDPPLSLLALAAFSAALFFALSSSSPLSSSWASKAPVSHLLSAVFEKPPLTLLCHAALFDLGVNSLRGLVSEKLRERGQLSGSCVEKAAMAAASSLVRCLCGLRDAALNPRDPRRALRTALLLVAVSSLNVGGGGGGGKGLAGVFDFVVLKRVFEIAAVSSFYACFVAGAAWRWWPRGKQNERRRPVLLRPDLSSAAASAAGKLSLSCAALAERTSLSALVEAFTSFIARSSLGTRVALGSSAAVVAWRLSAWSTRGAALLLLLLFARAHVFGEQVSKELTRRAMGHPVLASARKGCAALGSAARERMMMRRQRRRREEEEEEEEGFFEDEVEKRRGAKVSSELYSSRLQAAALNGSQQQQQQVLPHSSRPAAFRRGNSGVMR